MLEVGSIIGGRLRVEKVLGAGGMGIVVAATHLELGNKVAVKVLRDELSQNPTIVERFIREARAVVNLRTEHVCRVLDVGRLDNGAPYIVMEMLAGVDLAHSIAQRPLPVAMAVDYVMQACVALAEAHAAGIVHRDVKPANLFVTRRPDGGPLLKVLDFGIAKAMDAAGAHLTHTTGMMGSPGYMSPEQLLSARNVDTRTDIWALGVTLYQLVSARMPFPAPTLTEIAIKVASDPPDALDIDPELRAVIWRCLEKDPNRRYPSVVALAAELARFSSSDGRKTAAQAAQLAPPASVVPPTGPIPMYVPTAAATAASIATPMPMSPAITPAPVTPPPAHTAMPPVAPPRARWPLVLGALALVGVTVGVVLAVTGGKSAPAETVPVSTTPPTTTTPAPTTTTPAPTTPTTTPAPTVAAPVVIPGPVLDAGGPVAVGSGHDPWATPPEPPPRPQRPDAAVKDDEDEVTSHGFRLPEDQLAQARAGCRASLKGAPKPLPEGYAGMAYAMCYCAVGDIETAQKFLARTTDKDHRSALRSACEMYGATLK